MNKTVIIITLALGLGFGSQTVFSMQGRARGTLRQPLEAQRNRQGGSTLRERLEAERRRRSNNALIGSILDKLKDKIAVLKTQRAGEKPSTNEQ